jgi:hypothetical protein
MTANDDQNSNPSEQLLLPCSTGAVPSQIRHNIQEALPTRAFIMTLTLR